MITVLVGAQFGSEGKGAIVGHIAGGFEVHVRVGAANAGHTVYVDGEKHVVQQLPCAAYANPYADLVLGAGAMISAEILVAEILANKTWRRAKNLPPLRLYIDKRAHAVLPEHVQAEQEFNLEQSIGSTSSIAREGIGAAQAARVARAGYGLAECQEALEATSVVQCIQWVDTIQMLHDARVFDANILIEGTQGTGLDNVLGFHYPHVTSRHVVAAGLLADCGLGPQHADHVLLVARTYPIRVAGPSGPFWPDSKEIDWEQIGIDSEQERTTVTKKVRRVATFSYQQIKYAVQVNGATEIALTFADYLAPNIAKQSGLASAATIDSFDYVGPMIRRIEDETFCPVVYVGTGPATVLDREPAQQAVGG